MTNNKQQTAVDYIFSQLPAEYGTTRSAFDVYQQAKEMEKELTIRFALFYAYGQDNVSEQLRTKIEKWYDKIYEGGEQ
jgi:hypothetical protein